MVKVDNCNFRLTNFRRERTVWYEAAINFVELENRIISATYRNLMVKAKVVLVDKTSGEQLTDPVTTIASPVPSGLLRIRLPDAVKPGAYYLKALNGHGEYAAQSGEFHVG